MLLIIRVSLLSNSRSSCWSS